MLGEVVHKPPVEIFVHISETVSLSRKHQHIKSFSGTDKSLNDSHSIAGMHIIVNIPVDQKKMAFKICSNFRIGSDLIDKRCISLLGHLFLHAVMSLAPPAVVDIVVVIAGTGYRHLNVRVFRPFRYR